MQAPWSRSRVGALEASFPAAAAVSRAREGVKARATMAAAEHQLLRYELVVFELTRTLSPSEQEVLMRQVRRALRARADVVTASETESRLTGRKAAHVELSLRGGRRGLWRLLYLDAETMVQVSVVGPDSQELDASAARFFGSISIAGR